MDERGITVADIRHVLSNCVDIESRPDYRPYPARLVLGFCAAGDVHVAVRDNLADDETIVETAHWPAPLLWEPIELTKEDLMQCIVCHNSSEVPGTTTITFDRVGSTIVVRAVPA